MGRRKHPFNPAGLQSHGKEIRFSFPSRGGTLERSEMFGSVEGVEICCNGGTNTLGRLLQVQARAGVTSVQSDGDRHGEIFLHGLRVS